MDLQLGIAVQHARRKVDSTTEIPCAAHARQPVENWIETGPDRPRVEVGGLYLPPTPLGPYVSDQPLNPIHGAVHRRQVLLDGGLGRSGEATPHPGLQKPVEERIPLPLADWSRPAQLQVANHDRKRKASEQDSVMVQPQPVVDVVQAMAHMMESARQAGSYLFARSIMEVLKTSLSLCDRVHTPKQPVVGEAESIMDSPYLQAAPHLPPYIRPLGGDPRQRKITARQLGAPRCSGG